MDNRTFALLLFIILAGCRTPAQEGLLPHSDTDQLPAALQPEQNATNKNRLKHAFQGKKRALIVAVGDYQSASGWPAIHAHNDVALVQAALSVQGFDTLQDVRILRNAEATKSNITNAFQTHLLEPSQPGDVVVFHYSGHGQQITDTNHDELDGLDESLVPYDAPLRSAGDYQGEKHLIDDELEQWFIRLRNKLGPTGDLLVVLDACHSGTATRGQGTYRGSTAPLLLEGSLRATWSPDTAAHWLPNAAGDDKLSPMVVLSGAGAGELNYETIDPRGRRVGSLSYAFSEAMARATQHRTYQGLFDEIRVAMSALAPTQSPQLEGQANRYILGGGATRAPQDHYSITSWKNDTCLLLQGGQLAGLHPTTQVALYDIDVTDTTTVLPKATGVVEYASLSESLVTLDCALSKEEALQSWAVVTSRRWVVHPLRLQITTASPDTSRWLQRGLSGMSNILFVENAPDLSLTLEPASPSSQWVLRTAAGKVLYQQAADSLAISLQLTQQIRQYRQARFLRQLMIVDSALAVRMELIPVKEVEPHTASYEPIAASEQRLPLTPRELHSGDLFRLRLIHHGNRPVYFSVLDIQPDHRTNILFPNRHRSPAECHIMPGDTLVPVEVFRISPPYGQESFKLIATEMPLRLEHIVRMRGEVPGSFQPTGWEQLFADMYAQKTRGTILQAPNRSGSVHTLLFTIAE